MRGQRKRNIIIGFLCGFLLLMAVGYAAFATVLNIGGTSNITSNWNVKITNIQSKNIIGGATDISPPSYTDLTATFHTGLAYPTDSITYDIIITNAGSLDAFLEQIVVSKPTNSAFSISTSGVKKGDILSAGSSATLKVVISYSNSVTSQPENTEGELEITLNYVQKEAAEGSYIVNNVLKVAGSDSHTWFGFPLVKSSINTITIKNNKEVPDNVVSEYDIGEVPGNVLMWVDSDNNVIIGADGPIMANVNSVHLFGQFLNITALNGLENLDTSNVTNMSNMFQLIGKLTSLDVSNFDTSNVTNMSYMFAGMSSLISLDVSNFDTSKVNSMGVMLSGMSNLTSLNISNFDTSNVTNMSSMFSGTSSLTSLNVSNFDTSKVTNMVNMFYGMSSLKSLDLSNFDTSKITSMNGVFSGMSSLTNLNVSSFDTSKVTSMSTMFYGMSSLKSLNLSNFGTSNVTNMSYMFYGMSSLTSLNLSNFDTSNVTNMTSMFSGTSSLTSLDFRKATFDSATSYSSIFSNVKTGATIYTKDTTTKAWLQGKYPSGNYIIP